MLITDLQYFGAQSFFQDLVQYDRVVFDQIAPFTKMSFKNRMVITSDQGPLHLTIPIVGGRDQKTSFGELYITYDTNWQRQHFRALTTSYSRSPYFEYYVESIEHLYQTKPEKLVDFLLLTQEWVKKQLRGQWTIETMNLNNKAQFNNEVVERKYHPWLPKNYSQFQNALNYQQVFQEKTGFHPNVCILDLLFCVGGRQAINLLKFS